jgi:hypothetical protein
VYLSSISDVVTVILGFMVEIVSILCSSGVFVVETDESVRDSGVVISEVIVVVSSLSGPSE